MNLEIYAQRRKKLAELAKKEFGAGVTVLFADFESEGAPFLQESNFYYLSGINEPGIAMVIDADGKTEIYIPDTQGLRAKWVAGTLSLEDAQKFDVSEIKYLGSPITGYEPSPFLNMQNYSNLMDRLSGVMDAGGKIFAVAKNKVVQTFVLDQLCKFESKFKDQLIDVSDLAAQLRRTKSNLEADYLCQAIEITAMAQEAAAKSIVQGTVECEVQAAIEYVFISAGASIAFPSIVGSGKNSTVLHYYQNSAQLKEGDLVVVDIGARLNHYCADITRTYPVGGKFTKRQREVYQIVLETQQYIAELAKPGMWMANKDNPEKSLLHLAREFLSKKGGYDKYFIHGIGHYLGIDVHDVGEYKTPLKEGDVITIEPGVYISEENLGVRIEDNYWMTAKGLVCLSEQIPKEIEEVEKIVGNKW